MNKVVRTVIELYASCPLPNIADTRPSKHLLRMSVAESSGPNRIGAATAGREYAAWVGTWCIVVYPWQCCCGKDSHSDIIEQ